MLTETSQIVYSSILFCHLLPAHALDLELPIARALFDVPVQAGSAALSQKFIVVAHVELAALLVRVVSSVVASFGVVIQRRSGGGRVVVLGGFTVGRDWWFVGGRVS